MDFRFLKFKTQDIGMQNICYIDQFFTKEDSLQYILSIRYTTDGLSFCIHNDQNKLLVFFHQPYNLDHRDTVIAKVKQILVDNTLLNLQYKKVYVMTCSKEKILIPKDMFDETYLPDMYRICAELEKNDTLLYRYNKPTMSYIIEALPRNFVSFLSARYQDLCIANSAHVFIISSLSTHSPQLDRLFVDIHNQYMDILIARDNQVRLFNSFAYNSVADMAYYILNCLKRCETTTENLCSTFSGNLVDDPKLSAILKKYISNINMLNYSSLNQLIGNSEFNSSCMLHLLNMHLCE